MFVFKNKVVTQRCESEGREREGRKKKLKLENMKAVTNQINQITSDLKSKGFQEYGDFSHPDRIEYKDINQFYMTCLKGKYEGGITFTRGGIGKFSDGFSTRMGICFPK